MSENSKTVSRPKVRFSDNVSNKEESVEQCKGKPVLRANGPKIRSIVSLKTPVKIVCPKKSLNDSNKDGYLSTCKTEISTDFNDIVPNTVQCSSSFHDNVPTAGTSKILCNIDNAQNIKKNCDLLQTVRTLCPQDILKDYMKDTQRKGKENNNTVAKTIISSKNTTKITTGDSQHKQTAEQRKSKFPTSTCGIQTIKITDGNSKVKSQFTSSAMKKSMSCLTKKESLNVKSPILTSIPCQKSSKTKNKILPTKRTVLHNVSGTKIKTSVGPGVSHKHRGDSKINENKKCIFKSDAAVEQLAKPEYNSIICTINKLKELKQRKIVTDINHLPHVQKNLVIGKISTALDFPMDEAIFKNLVDLTIDDKQLPSTITRSKDPEPRQKDIVPILSDFFVPEDTKEICAAVHVKHRTPKIDENWNVFKISDKIFEWKCNLDEV